MARNSPSNRKNEGRRSDHIHGSEADTSAEEYKVGPGHPPKQFQFKPGQSGNPRGAKRKPPSIAPDLKRSLERALSTNVKIKQGEREQMVTMGEAGIKQLVAQFAKGDRHARRDLIALAGKLGVDLGQYTAIKQALALNHQAILEAYVARRSDRGTTSSGSPVFAPPELVDDDAENENPK